MIRDAKQQRLERLKSQMGISKPKETTVNESSISNKPKAAAVLDSDRLNTNTTKKSDSVEMSEIVADSQPTESEIPAVTSQDPQDSNSTEADTNVVRKRL